MDQFIIDQVNVLFSTFGWAMGKGGGGGEREYESVCVSEYAI